MRLARPKFEKQGFLVAVAIFLGTPLTAEAQEPYFPDLVFLPKNKGVNSIIVDATQVHLKAMKEPSLWKFSQTDRTATAYRFLWLATGRHPISIRLTRTGEAFALHVAAHDGPPGLTAGRQTLDKDVKLTVQQGRTLIARLEDSKFWTSPVSVKETLGIADGDRIVIEGVKAGRYHVIDRAGSTMGESSKGFCRSLIELADEPESLRIWDINRRGERESPGYRPEPPQTEDLGEDPSDKPE